MQRTSIILLLVVGVMLSGCLRWKIYRNHLDEKEAGQPPAIDKEGWVLTFSEEFDGNSIDESKWNYSYSWGNTLDGNQERQLYFPDNIAVANGICTIEARMEKREGYAYTSGMLSSHNKWTQQYGYFEMRVKLPKGNALWPAFWLLPYNHYRPEIDIMEYRGQEPNKIQHTNHYYKGEKYTHNTTKVEGPDFSLDYHTYAVDWNENEISWFVDGVRTHRSRVGVPQVPMYIITNLAVGGGFLGFPDDPSVFPAQMQIDYIRAYKKENV